MAYEYAQTYPRLSLTEFQAKSKPWSVAGLLLSHYYTTIIACMQGLEKRLT